MTSHQRTIDNTQLGPGSILNQGNWDNVTINYNHHPPHAPTPGRPAACIIPYEQNRKVVHRPDITDKLHAILLEDHRCAALWGFGGSGKTQIALDYAYSRHKSDGPDACAVFWVHAESEATFAHDYGTIAAKLGIPTSLKGQELFGAVCREIEMQPTWVMVIDNADNLSIFGVSPPGVVGTPAPTAAADLRDHVPRGKNGTVLWTSRDGYITELVGPERAINVGPMKVSEGTSLLSTELPPEAGAGNKVDLEGAEGDGSQLLLLEELEYLPLAISQAAAYIRHTRTDVLGYLSLLREQQQRWDILAESHHDRYRKGTLPNSVLGTWSISVKQIQLENPTAYRILCVIAFLDNQNIPLSILTAASGLDAGMTVLVRRAVARLQDFSFIGKSKTLQGEARYEMHKLVQEAARYHLQMPETFPAETNAKQVEQGISHQRTPDGEAFFAHEALQIMTKLFPYSDLESDREVWDRCEELLAHALSIANTADASHKNLDSTDLLANLSNFLSVQSRWREQEVVQERLLRTQRETLGKSHPATMNSMFGLAQTYRLQEKFAQAEELISEVVRQRSEEFGDRDPESLRMRAELGNVLQRKVRYLEAQQILEDVLKIQREVFGDGHEDTATTMTSLADLSYSQGRLDEAIELQTMALEIFRELFGEKHLQTIVSMSNCALYYRSQGRHVEAESLAAKAFTDHCHLFGEGHPDSIAMQIDLGSVHMHQNRNDEAEDIFANAFQTARETLGTAHPVTLRSMSKAASVLIHQDRLPEAETKILEALDLHREIRGEEHPDTLYCSVCLAIIWHDMEKYEEAICLMRECLSARRRVLGPKHPHTVDAARRLDDWEREIGVGISGSGTSQ